ncbi:MAG: ATP-binding protein [Chloroflexi bacterium]|nr:ATP-binding protein [Chloroflexota bacterium]
MTTIIADYEAERQAVLDLFQPSCDCRIVLLCGASGSGKTTLLTHCRERVPSSIFHLPVQLRGSTTTAAEVFYRAGRHLTWDRLPHFTGHVAGMLGGASIKVDRNFVAGIGNHINVALYAEQPLEREHRRVALTEAWFDDLVALPQPFLVFFDTYEQATAEMKEWLCGPFLARAAQVSALRVVIAGQEVPEARNIEWGHCCQEHYLHGVQEASAWLPVVQQLGRYIHAPDPVSYLMGICDACKGDPGKIIKWIEALPHRKSLP